MRLFVPVTRTLRYNSACARPSLAPGGYDFRRER
nr:MAG TPA_asm: hypothetical protein [Caudoviricetes sp.]